MFKDKESYKILYVEDDEIIRAIYFEYLKESFHNIFEASTIVEALKIYKHEKPDILIVDINLTDGSGLDILKNIRKNDIKTKAIVLTAHSDVDYLLKATELKLTKYLVKPVSKSDLQEALALAIEEIGKFEITNNHLLELLDNYKWNYKTDELFCEQTIISLTKNEIKFCKLMFENIGQTLTYDDISSYIWDEYDGNKINSVKLLLKSLRKKLPNDTIKNIYGIGYKV